MRVVLVSALVLVLTGCGDSERARFNRNVLQHYEVPCHRYYSIYESSDIEGAKKALNDIIALSLSEKSKAKYYWPFDTQIAFAQARLAVIAERQGQTQEAERLFSSASDYMMRGEKAMSLDMHRDGNTNDMSTEKVVTPADWRKAVREIDAQHHVKWDSPNESPEPTGAALPVFEGQQRFAAPWSGQTVSPAPSAQLSR